MSKKIIFMGTPAFSVPILEGLLADDYEILAVVTQPDRPVGRKKILTPPPVKVSAEKHQLLVLQPEKIAGSKEMKELMTMTPDLIVTAAFGQFLPESLLQLPKYGAINVHASLLPKYRGGAPVHYAIINGEKETGVTIMEMVKKMDAGAIYSQIKVPINKEDNVGTMFEKLSLAGKELLLTTLPKILEHTLTPTAQNEKQVTFSPNISREQEQINWHKTAEEIEYQVRGMYPWPTAFTTHNNVNWKILDVGLLNEKTRETPGTIIKKDKQSLWIACGKGTVLSVKKIQPAGKGQMVIRDFLNGVGQTVQPMDKVG